MKRLRKYYTEIEAEQARGLLQAEGIPAYVEGANSQTALAYIGPALGGVKLLVDEADMVRAEEILQRSAELPDIGPWTCGNCYSEVDAGFAVCWRCGADHSNAAQLDEDEGHLDTGQVDYRAAESEIPPEGRDESNPYQSPATVGSLAVEEVPASIEDKMQRAWLSAIAGTVLLPGVANLMSVFWLFQVAPYVRQLSPGLRNRFYIAVAVNACGFVVAAALFLSTLA